MTPATYEKLSQVYDRFWGPYSLRYLHLIHTILDELPVIQARILDIACGTGTLSLYLARDGHIVHGIDNSIAMIKQARQKARGCPNISYSVQNMSRFGFRELYDLVVCTFDSINYLLDGSDVVTFFESVKDVLDENGIFIFDINEEKQYTENYSGVFMRRSNEDSIILRRYFDPIRKIATALIEFRDGAIEVHKQKQYELSDIKKSLRSVNLTMYKNYRNIKLKEKIFRDNRTVCLVKKIKQ